MSDSSNASLVPQPARVNSRVKAWAFVLVSGVTAAHVYAAHAADTLSGPLLAMDHLFAVALATAMLALGAAVGRVAIRVVGLEVESKIEVLAFSAAVGAGILSTAILVCGAVVGLDGRVLSLILIAATFLVRRELALLPRIAREAMSELAAKAGMPALAVFLVIALSMMALAIAPPSDTDSLNYHLRVPAQFLERGMVHVPEDNLHVAWVGMVHFLYLPLLAYGAPTAAAVVNTIFALSLSAVLVPFAARFFSGMSGRLAMVLLWGSPIVILVAVTPKIDVTLAYYLFLGHYAVLRAYRSPEDATRWLVLGAGLLGFGVGIKYLALPFIAALAPLILMIAVATTETAVRRVRLLAVFAAVVTTAALPWLIKNWVLLGAPLYPMFAEHILPPWVAALYGTTDLSVGIDPASLRPLAAVREPFNLVDWFLAPEKLTPESEGWAYGANPIFLSLVFAVPLLRRHMFAALLVPTLLYIGIILLLATRINLRYLIPAIPGLTVAAACVIAMALDRVRRSAIRVSLLVTVTVFTVLSAVAALARKLTDTRALAHAAGVVSRRDYLFGAHDVEIAPYAWMTAHVNQLLPRDARILLFFEARGYGFAPRVLQDNVMTNWVLLEPAVTPPRCLESSGITHVLVGTGTLQYFTRRGFDPRIIHWDRFDAFAARCLVLIDRRPDISLYRVASPAGS